MLDGCSNMVNVDVSKLDTSKVTTMCHMFSGCKSLMRLDVSSFDTSQVTDMSYMFSNCSSLTQLVGSHFTTDQVLDMSNMFSGCNSLTKLDLSHFNNNQVQKMGRMFYDCSSLTNLNLSYFNTSQVTDMKEMFRGCSALTNLDLSYFNTGQVKNMNSMFMLCDNIKELDLSSFNTENVTNMSGMFYKCSSMTNLNLSRFDIGKVINISNMFDGCLNLLELDLSNFGANQSTDMGAMFNGCNSLTKLDLSCLDTSRVTSMSAMFEGCRSLTKLDLSHFDTGQVKNMQSMFSECRSLEYLNISHFDTSNVTQAGSMFSECRKLMALDLSSFDFSKITSNQWLTMDCFSLTRIDTPYNINVSIYLSGRTWYTSEGVEVTEMPKNLDHSVALGLNHIPSIEKPVIPPDDEEPEENEIDSRQKYVQNLTKVSLANADEDSREKIQNAIYNLLFKAQFRPMESKIPNDTMVFTGTEQEIAKWPIQNKDYKVAPAWFDMAVQDSQLGLVKFDEDAAGCKAYACFATAYIYSTSGAKETGDDLSEKGIKDFIHKYADPGEHLRYGSDAKSFWHSIVFLGESEDGKGFYYISYEGGARERHKPAHNLFVDYWSYKDFANKVRSVGNYFYIRSANGGSYAEGTAQTLTAVREGKGVKTNILRLQCPVEATVSINGETLDSRNPRISSFGKVEKSDEGIVFTLEYSTDYKLTIVGTGEGSMTLIQEYYDGAGNLIDQRKFVNVPIKESAEILSSRFNSQATFALYVPNEAGEVSAWEAGVNETVYGFNETMSYENDVDDDDFSDGIHYKDIPESVEIPNGLWISAIPDYTYTGTAVKPEVRVYDGEKRLKPNKDYTVSYRNNTKAAQADDAKPPTIVVKGKGNYSGTETQTFNITKRDISDTCVSKTFTDAYVPLASGKNPALVFSAKCNKKGLKKNTDYTLTIKDSAGRDTDFYATEGAYSLVVKGTGANYTGECSFSFEVLDKIPVSKLKINKIAAIEFDGTSKRPQPVIKYGKVTLNKGADYSLRYQNNREMGTATITITGKGEYFGTRNVTFTITGRQIKKA